MRAFSFNKPFWSNTCGQTYFIALFHFRMMIVCTIGKWRNEITWYTWTLLSHKMSKNVINFIFLSFLCSFSGSRSIWKSVWWVQDKEKRKKKRTHTHQQHLTLAFHLLCMYERMSVRIEIILVFLCCAYTQNVCLRKRKKKFKERTS